MSQNTALHPLVIIDSAVEIQVFTGTIISEFFGKSKDWIAISKASVPFPREIQYLLLTNFEKFFSEFLTSFPPTKFEFLMSLLIFILKILTERVNQ